MSFSPIPGDKNKLNLDEIDKHYSQAIPGEWYRRGPLTDEEACVAGGIGPELRSYDADKGCEEGDNYNLLEDYDVADIDFMVAVHNNWPTISRLARLGAAVKVAANEFVNQVSATSAAEHYDHCAKFADSILRLIDGGDPNYWVPPRTEGKVGTVTDATFKTEVLAASDNLPVVVLFYAKWCGPCAVVQPHLKDLALEMQGVKFVEIDVDTNPVMTQNYQIRATPSIYLFNRGQVREHLVGAVPKSSIQYTIQKHFKCCP